jgi:hypothetical protein
VAGKGSTNASVFAIAVLLFVAASVALVIALATSGFACDDVTTNACGRNDLATAQLVVAIIGFLPLGLLVWDLLRGRGRQAAAWFAVGAVLDLGWGVLNDAAVHGWQHLSVF